MSSLFYQRVSDAHDVTSQQPWSTFSAGCRGYNAGAGTGEEAESQGSTGLTVRSVFLAVCCMCGLSCTFTEYCIQNSLPVCSIEKSVDEFCITRKPFVPFFYYIKLVAKLGEETRKDKAVSQQCHLCINYNMLFHFIQPDLNTWEVGRTREQLGNHSAVLYFFYKIIRQSMWK